MNAIILLFLSIAVVPAFSKLEIFDGHCPSSEVDYIKDFNQTKFAGTWYILERYEYDEFMQCSRVKYYWSEEERKFDTLLKENAGPIPIRYVSSQLWERERYSDTGKYVYWTYLFQRHRTHFVDTDYENYALLWTCSQRGPVNAQNLIVMARDTSFDINSSESLNATLARPSFDRKLLKKIEHQHEWCLSQA